MTSSTARRLDETRNMANTVRWLDDADFMVYPIQGTTWNDVPGVYIFAVQRWPGGHWYPIYVGKTESFARRLPSHEREAEALEMGATAVHARGVQLGTEREILERVLIEKYQPELNILYRGPHPGRRPQF